MSTAVDRRFGFTGEVAIKGPCVAATTANITLSGAQTIDGVAVVAGDRVLVKDQTTASQNGIYTVSANAWERATDFNGNTDVKKGTLVYVHSGSTNVASWRVTTSDPIVIDSSSIAFSISGLSTTVTEYMATVLNDSDAGEARTTLGAASLSANTFTAAQTIQSAAPNLVFDETGATADNGRWDFTIDGEAWRLRATNDAGSSATNVIIVQRTGLTIDSITFASSLSSTKACATGFTRITPNYCQRNAALSIGQSVNSVSDYLNITPSDTLTDAKALSLGIQLGVQTANAVAKRYTTVTLYAGPAATGISTRAYGEMYENVAIPATDIYVSYAVIVVACASNGSFSVTSRGSPATAGSSEIYLLGYFD